MRLTSRAATGILYLFVALLFCASVASSSIAEYKPEIKSIHWSSAEDYTRVVIDLTKKAKFSHNRIKNPDRVYVDLDMSVLPPNVKKTLRVGDGIIERIRVSHFTVNTVRVVLDLKKAKKYEVNFLSNPPRIVIDVFSKGGKKRTDLKKASPGIKAVKAV
jgi:N-acetylmuramoyl-L-alanine amidase